MSLFEELEGLGVNVSEGMNRLGGNEALYTRLLGTFTKTIGNYEILPDFDPADCEALVEKAHAIKGTAGNLSITPVYAAYTTITDMLRAGKPEEARAAQTEILPVQKQIIECIGKNMQ